MLAAKSNWSLQSELDQLKIVSNLKETENYHPRSTIFYFSKLSSVAGETNSDWKKEKEKKKRKLNTFFTSAGSIVKAIPTGWRVGGKDQKGWARRRVQHEDNMIYCSRINSYRDWLTIPRRYGKLRVRGSLFRSKVWNTVYPLEGRDLHRSSSGRGLIRLRGSLSRIRD